MKSLLDEPVTKMQFSGHETFPCKQGWFKKCFDAVSQASTETCDEGRNVFNPETGVVEFGVGRNMVLSMRHWALACGVIEGLAGKGGLPLPSSLGRLLFTSCDPYLEHPGSIWALHWRLVRAPGRATVWYYAFNEFNEAVFSRDSLKERLGARIEECRRNGSLKGARITDTTLIRDVECFMRTYVARNGARGTTEDSLECPFTELALVTPLAVGAAAQFRRGPKPTLPDQVFAFALVEFWQTHYATRGALSVDTVTHDPGSPGRAFLLDEESVAERLGRIAEATAGAIAWDESSGLRQVSSRAIATLDAIALLERLYAGAQTKAA